MGGAGDGDDVIVPSFTGGGRGSGSGHGVATFDLAQESEFSPVGVASVLVISGEVIASVVGVASVGVGVA